MRVSTLALSVALAVGISPAYAQDISPQELAALKQQIAELQAKVAELELRADGQQEINIANKEEYDKLAAQGAKGIVLDLRGNGGGIAYVGGQICLGIQHGHCGVNAHGGLLRRLTTLPGLPGRARSQSGQGMWAQPIRLDNFQTKCLQCAPA